MKNLLKKSITGLSLLILLTGCAHKNDTKLIELKPNLNTLTLRANSAIQRRNIPVSETKSFLNKQYSEFMKTFEEYDLNINSINDITIVLVCKDDKAIFEDLSCDLKIDGDYSKENRECKFYIQEPTCNK